MRTTILLSLFMFVAFAAPSLSQKTLVIYDPTVQLMDEVPALPDAEQAVFDSSVLPKLKAKYQSDSCGVDPELAGEVSGRFTKKGVVQKAAFYQVCQTGNGLGVVAIVIFENDKLVGIWGEESGWSMAINTVNDLNANGIDEFTLVYGGGMHQGEGGIGVDLMEFQNGKLNSLAWFQAEKIVDTESDSGWKVSVKKGKTPVFYRQKYKANSRSKLIKTGTNSVFKPTKGESKFELIK